MKVVCFNQDIEPYAKERDRAVTEALQAAGISVFAYWDQLLHAPEGRKGGWVNLTQSTAPSGATGAASRKQPP